MPQHQSKRAHVTYQQPSRLVRVLLRGLVALLLLLSPLVRACFAQCVISARHPAQDIFFLGRSDGWILYADGSTQYVARTHDGGQTWTSLPNQPPLTKFYFLTRRLGWAIGVNSTGRKDSPSYTLPLFFTQDGGEHWSGLPAKGFPAEQPMVVSGILFVDRSHGWLVGEKEYGLSFVYETFNGGLTFHYISALSDQNGTARGISWDRNSRIWVYGNDSLFVSSNRGKSWVRTLRSGALPGGYNHLVFMTGWLSSNSAGVIGAQGVGGVILSTDNGGKNWDLRLETKDAVYFTSASFWNNRHGCVVGSSNFLFCTKDGGRSLSGRDVLPRPRVVAHEGCSPSDMNVFTKLIMSESGKGWLLGDDGRLYQTEDGGQSWRVLDPVAEFRRP
jgi:photosystem II stability/assembly factor-like uncharacterized protein